VRVGEVEDGEDLREVAEEEVLVQPVRVRVASEVEPVAPPALAETRRLEQPVDEKLEGVLPRVREEVRDLPRRGRQTDEPEEDPPEERAAIGVGSGTEARRLEIPEDERVDGRAGPVRGLDGGRRGGGERQEGPVPAAGNGVRWALSLRRALERDGRREVRGTRPAPRRGEGPRARSARTLTVAISYPSG
jgi:hypothetical protein